MNKKDLLIYVLIGISMFILSCGILIWSYVYYKSIPVCPAAIVPTAATTTPTP